MSFRSMFIGMFCVSVASHTSLSLHVTVPALWALEVYTYAPVITRIMGRRDARTDRLLANIRTSTCDMPRL